MVRISRGAGSTRRITIQGDIWIGSPNAGVWRLPYGSVPVPGPGDTLVDPTPVHYGAEAGLPAGRNRINVRSIGGRPLFLTSNGLYRFDSETEKFAPDTRFDPRFADGTPGRTLVGSPLYLAPPQRQFSSIR